MQHFILSDRFFEHLYGETAQAIATMDRAEMVPGYDSKIFEEITSRLGVDPDTDEIFVRGANYTLAEESKLHFAVFYWGIMLGQYLARRNIYLRLEETDKH